MFFIHWNTYNFVESILEKISKYHKKWIEILTALGCNKVLAEDLVQEMYIKVHQYIKDHKKSILYNGEVNTFFIYVMLKNMYFDYCRQKNRINITSWDDLEWLGDKIEDEIFDGKTNDEYNKHLSIQEWYNDDLYLELLELDNITEAEYTKDELGKYYMRRIFKEVYLDRVKVSELSRSTNITYWSLRNTLKIIKKEIKKYYETRRFDSNDN